MENTILMVFVFVMALAIGVFFGKLFYTANFKSEKAGLEEKYLGLSLQILDLKEQLTKLNNEKESIREEKDSLVIKLTKKEGDYENLMVRANEQKAEVEKLQERFTKEFENLANKILEEKTSKFTEQNKENLKNILLPLQENIQSFEKKVSDTHKESIDYHASLRQQIVGLKDINEKMSKETVNLTKALKGDSKTQGNWGELILETVLEKSGLKKDFEYYVQKSLKDGEGVGFRPDVVINMPDGKKMIIDSKVSLTAYEKYVSEDDENLKNVFVKDHLKSVYAHILGLSEKNYQDLYEIESPDFVLLFIPIEPAFALALNSDTNLYNKAFEKNIVIVTPTTLLAVLKIICNMWSNQHQQNNASEIARQAGALYDKFTNFINDLIGVGKKLDEAKIGYSEAMNKLSEGNGNIVISIEKLKVMGAKAKKSLPENLLIRANKENEE